MIVMWTILVMVGRKNKKQVEINCTARIAYSKGASVKDSHFLVVVCGSYTPYEKRIDIDDVWTQEEVARKV